MLTGTTHKVSWAKQIMVVGKITLGLGQVVSRQPSAMETEFPGPQWDSPFIKLFFMDFGWVK